MMEREERKLDPNTGQVYYEKTVKARSMIPKWIWRTRGRQDKSRNFKNRASGASSLMDMVVRSVAYNMNRIGPEALGHIPDHIVKKLADYITSCETWSLETWETVVAAHPEAVPTPVYELDIHAQEGAFLHQLPALAKHLSALNFDHITRLNIRELAFTTENLFEISRIPNLEVLELQARTVRTFSGIPDDSVYNNYFFSRWCRVIIEEGRLPHLKVLILRQFELTLAILEHLAPFPALMLCNIMSNTLRLDFNHYDIVRDGWRHVRTPEAQWRSGGSRTTRDILRYYCGGSGVELPLNGGLEHVTRRLPCISIDYGPKGSARGTMPGAQSDWYCKLVPQGKTRRKQAEEDSPTKGCVLKKVKVGKGKRKAVGDLLGSFI